MMQVGPAGSISLSLGPRKEVGHTRGNVSNPQPRKGPHRQTFARRGGCAFGPGCVPACTAPLSKQRERERETERAPANFRALQNLHPTSCWRVLGCNLFPGNLCQKVTPMLYRAFFGGHDAKGTRVQPKPPTGQSPGVELLTCHEMQVRELRTLP